MQYLNNEERSYMTHRLRNTFYKNICTKILLNFSFYQKIWDYLYFNILKKIISNFANTISGLLKIFFLQCVNKNKSYSLRINENLALPVKYCSQIDVRNTFSLSHTITVIGKNTQ